MDSLQPDDEFGRLVRAWRAGSPDALGELFNRYSDPLRRVIRRRLSDKLRPQFDSLDFVQDVWASVVALPPERYTFTAPDDLIGFLLRVAGRKLIDVRRGQFEAESRNVGREERLPADADDSNAALRDQAPSPSQLFIGQEKWDYLLAQLKPGQQAVLRCLREGYTQEEIAARLGIATRTVERIVRRLKSLCES